MDPFVIAATLLYSRKITGVIRAIVDLVFVALIISEIYSFRSLFPKMGINPKYASYPFINTYQLYKKVLNSKWALIHAILAIGFIITYGYTDKTMNIVCFIIFLFYALIGIITKIKLVKSFNRDFAYMVGLIFVEEVFYYLLGHEDCEYKETELNFRLPFETFKKYKETRHFSRRYMIDLDRRRSYIALLAGVLGFAFAFRGLTISLMDVYYQKAIYSNYSVFHFFTINSNLFSAIGSTFMIPYAIEGIRRKRFVFPKWITLFQFSGAFCLTLTMVFAVIFIFPTMGAKEAFGNANFFSHIICPIMAIILLFTVETDRSISISEMMVCMFPFIIYSLIYIINVVLIGEKNGGWRDIYLLAAFIRPTISATLMYLFAFFIAALLRYLYNKVAQRRLQRLISHFNPDASKVEINIEVYGLGRYNGKYLDIYNITMPIDIFKVLSNYYNLDIDKLSAIYNKGVMDGLKEREKDQ